MIAVHRRQRRIEVLGEVQVPPEAVLRERAHAHQDLVDIDRVPLQRPASENTSMRSTRLQTRSVSSRIRRVRGLLFGTYALLGSCAAPRMPASGSSPHARASPPSPRPIWPPHGASSACRSWRRERSCIDSTTAPSTSGNGVACTLTTWMADTRAGERDLILDHGTAGGARLADQREQRTVGRHKLIEALATQIAGAALEELFSGIVEIEDQQSWSTAMTTDATTFRIRSGSISTRRGCLRSLKTLLKITSLSGAWLFLAGNAPSRLTPRGTGRASHRNTRYGDFVTRETLNTRTWESDDPTLVPIR